METLLQFALLLIVVIGAPIIAISIVAGAVNLVRLIGGADTVVGLRGEVVGVGGNLRGRPGAPIADNGDGARAAK
jgi:hypothetical protein